MNTKIDARTLKLKFQVVKNKDIPNVRNLLAHSPASIYVSRLKENDKTEVIILLTDIIRKDTMFELLHGYNVLHGIEVHTGECRSLRITEEGIVESHHLGQDGWKAIPLEIVHIYIPH